MLTNIVITSELHSIFPQAVEAQLLLKFNTRSVRFKMVYFCIYEALNE